MMKSKYPSKQYFSNFIAKVTIIGLEERPFLIDIQLGHGRT